MSTHSVIEDLDVFPDCRYGFVACLEVTVMHELLLEMPPETLGGSVVVAVSLSRHGRDHSRLLHVPAILCGTVLASPIGMVNAARQSLSELQCHFQGILHELRSHSAIHGVA